MGIKLNPFSKIALVILVGAVAYLAVFLALSPVISPRPTTMMQMMGSFGSTNSVIVNLVSFILAVLSAFLFSLYLLKSEEKKTGGKSELAILKKALSEDAKN